MTDRLSSYGYAFQIKVITALLTDKSFLEQISFYKKRGIINNSPF